MKYQNQFFVSCRPLNYNSTYIASYKQVNSPVLWLSCIVIKLYIKFIQTHKQYTVYKLHVNNQQWNIILRRVSLRKKAPRKKNCEDCQYECIYVWSIVGEKKWQTFRNHLSYGQLWLSTTFIPAYISFRLRNSYRMEANLSLYCLLLLFFSS